MYVYCSAVLSLCVVVVLAVVVSMPPSPDLVHDFFDRRLPPPPSRSTSGGGIGLGAVPRADGHQKYRAQAGALAEMEERLRAEFGALLFNAVRRMEHRLKALGERVKDLEERKGPTARLIPHE